MPNDILKIENRDTKGVNLNSSFRLIPKGSELSDLSGMLQLKRPVKLNTLNRSNLSATTRKCEISSLLVTRTLIHRNLKSVYSV